VAAPSVALAVHRVRPSRDGEWRNPDGAQGMSRSWLHRSVEYTFHAQGQMVERELTEANVGAVLAAPTKQTPGRNCCFNLGGCGPSKKHIRVTGPDTHAHHHRGRCRFEDREMTQPLNVRVDLSARAPYVKVKYALGPSASTLDLDESGSVAYDLDAGGTIVLNRRSPRSSGVRTCTLYISTFRRHIEATGGRLDITAHFPKVMPSSSISHLNLTPMRAAYLWHSSLAPGR
jgi:hypothetical protein